MGKVDLPAFLGGRLRHAGNTLAEACEKMPDDRCAWNPIVEGNKGRDALDQALECAYLNGYGAGAFRDGVMPAFDASDYKSRQDAHRSPKQAIPWLREATEYLAGVVEACTEEKLATTVTNPFTKKECSLADFADFLYWNTVYHEGQVNYIQVLYGDMS
ncbi:MAG: hypothetical protein KGJ62_14170 [Armatimonadetes bacterium]|nr:hypothetical protein [Armatimonadota bacterium]MDE2206996.1 hypothetical protein [Armatimonadota bacterium]